MAFSWGLVGPKSSLQTEEMHDINVAMSRMDEEINTMGDRMLFQRNLAEVARLNGLSAANRVEGPEEAFQMFYAVCGKVWSDLVATSTTSKIP